MWIFRQFLLLVIFSSCILLSQSDSDVERLQKYIHILNESGRDPIQFIVDSLRDYDLIIFGDALHTAVEPFEYYQKLIETPAFCNPVKYIFLVAISINKQPQLAQSLPGRKLKNKGMHK
jgi:hypothetical protein